MVKTSKKKELFLDSNPFETRLALCENDRLAEFIVERVSGRGISGNIYKGKVVRVLPGMQAAFVEVGLERTAFLHVSDVMSMPDDDEDGGNGSSKASSGSYKEPRIQDLLKHGQEVLVQVEKEPIGTKGARLTAYPSIPGRYLVLIPTHEKVAISRRIDDDRERRRLKDMVRKLRPPGFGFIIRTVCVGKSTQEIQSDMEYLVKLWKGIEREMQTRQAPALLTGELDLTLRTIRDTLSPEISRFVIDSKEEYEKAAGFIRDYLPELTGRVEEYKGEVSPSHSQTQSMFDAYGIEVELTKALEKKAWLPSGGFLVLDQMEALTAIDVNTGKYVGKKNSEQTILKTNLEAVKEVVRQLRLRNIGGIIVIDFIDMEKHANRDKVYNTLKLALKSDKAKTNIFKISELGIVEMTRKRTRESLAQSLLETCTYCDGSGLVKGIDTVLIEIYRDLMHELAIRRGKTIMYTNPMIAERLKEKGGVVELLTKQLKKKIIVKVVDTFHQEEYEIV